MVIRELAKSDWTRVFEIYKQGIDSGKTTFSTHYPTWEEWDAGHNKPCRYVAELDGEIIGFAAVSPISGKPHYYGVVEVMVYVDERYWHHGAGTGLLKQMIKDAPENGFWCLYSSIYSSNEKSLNLHKKCGFRTIGYRERIAKDRFGNWTDTILMEYRFADEIVKDVNKWNKENSFLL